MPPIDGCEYLIDLWHQAGTLESNGMGVGKLSWQEIDSWLEVRKKVGHPILEYWEVEIIRQLSEAYSNEYNLSSDKNREPPYKLESLDALDRVGVANKMKNILRGLRKNAQEKYIVEEG